MDFSAIEAGALTLLKMSYLVSSLQGVPLRHLRLKQTPAGGGYVCVFDDFKSKSVVLMKTKQKIIEVKLRTI